MGVEAAVEDTETEEEVEYIETEERRESPSLKKDLENLVLSAEKEATSLIRLAPRWATGYSREAFFGKGKVIEVSDDVDETKPPIVFLYGYASNRGVNRVSDYLADLGYRVYEIVTPFLQKIEKQVKIAKKHIEEVFYIDEKPMVLIGHSMGGLVGKHFIYHDQTKAIKSYISLATPHLGTLPGRIVPGASGKQMALASKFTQDLWKNHLSEHIQTTAFVPTYDYVVFPPNLMPDGINLLFPRKNHVMIIDSKKTAEWIDFAINHYDVIEEMAEYREFRPSLGMRMLDRLPVKTKSIKIFEELMSQDFKIVTPSVLRETQEANPYNL